jgi:hypothetical protein
MRPRITARITLCLVAAAGLAALAGCHSSQFQDALCDPSPDEVNLTQNPNQIRAGMAYTLDTNKRLLWDDIGRFWMMDRPSRLTPYVSR